MGRSAGVKKGEIEENRRGVTGIRPVHGLASSLRRRRRQHRAFKVWTVKGASGRSVRRVGDGVGRD
jgi:hypothetical protein